MSKKSNKLALDNLKGFQKGLSAGKINGFIPTNHTELDYFMVSGLLEEDEDFKNKNIQGGFPVGKVIVIYGGEGSGKSSLAYRAASSAQEQGMTVAWFDVENSFSPQLAKINGADPDEMYVNTLVDPDDPDENFPAEKIIDLMMETCKFGAGLIVLDSLSSLVPQYVMDNPGSQDSMAVLPRVLSRLMPKLVNHAHKYNTTILIINQLREDPGVRYGDPQKMPGGRAVKHAASIILKITKKSKGAVEIETDDGEKEEIGFESYVKITKNRFAPPLSENLIIPIYTKKYQPSPEDLLFTYGRELKVISVRKGIFSWNGIKGKEEGKISFLNEVKSENKINDLLEEIKSSAEKNNKVLDAKLLNHKFEKTSNTKTKLKNSNKKEDAQIEEFDLNE